MSYVDDCYDCDDYSVDSQDYSSDMELSRLRKNQESESEESYSEPSREVEEVNPIEEHESEQSAESEEVAPIKQRGRGKIKGTKVSHDRYVLEKIEGDEAVEMGRYPTIQGVADALGFPYHKAYGIWRGQNRALCKKYIISKLD